jgi:D-alanine-D-alanine ligase
MEKKTKVGIIFGGRSAEHEVSLRSARNIVDAIDKAKYDVVLIFVAKDGKWFLCKDESILNNLNGAATPVYPNEQITLAPEGRGHIFYLSGDKPDMAIDVAFPVLHGPFGEDGTVQGLLKLSGIPFVGSGVLGSAVGMDKDVMKRLLKEAGIPIGAFLVLKKEEPTPLFDMVADTVGLPFFVKPANMGSSVGISKVTKENDYERATEEAFRYDLKIIFEEYIEGKEIECAVLGNFNPEASVPGEIVVKDDFYSYDAKYINESKAILKVPASLSSELEEKVKELSIRAYVTLCAEGLGRVDLFLRGGSELLVNEINTIPGFTSISMYPRLWEKSGLQYSKLLDRLIELAFDRFKSENKLQSEYDN